MQTFTNIQTPRLSRTHWVLYPYCEHILFSSGKSLTSVFRQTYGSFDLWMCGLGGTPYSATRMGNSPCSSQPALRLSLGRGGVAGAKLDGSEPVSGPGQVLLRKALAFLCCTWTKTGWGQACCCHSILGRVRRGLLQNEGNDGAFEVWILPCLRQAFQVCKSAQSPWCFRWSQSALPCHHLQHWGMNTVHNEGTHALTNS